MRLYIFTGIIKTAAALLAFIATASGCTTGSSQDRPRHPLEGKWEYRNCSIKNTSVVGTVTFRNDGTFVLKATPRDDYPIEDDINGVYTWETDGARLITNYEAGYGFSEYFYISGDTLYFTNVDPAKDPDMQYWRFKLIRVR